MKVKELIGILQQYDSETLVVVEGYKNGVDVPLAPVEVMIRLNVHSEYYYGSHEISNKSAATTKVVYLQRPDRYQGQ